jgi:putative DNA primase/helicase
LTADGAGKAQVTPPRKFLGNVRGGAVRLARDSAAMAVGEGIETSLSYLQLTGIPTWAALSSNGLMAVELPERCIVVDILVDRDRAGERAAQVAGERFTREGRTVNLVQPNVGNDLNDALRETIP